MSVGPIIPPSGGPPSGGPPSGGIGGVSSAAGSPQAGGGAGATAQAPAATGVVAGPQADLATLIGADVAAQDSLAPLLADLAVALQTGAMPAAAQATAQQVLALQVPLDEAVTGQTLRAAVVQSGLFLEAGLAASAQAPHDLSAAPYLAGDLKALLLRLPLELTAQSEASAQRAAQSALVSQDAAHRRTTSRPPPPVAGGPTSAQPAARASIGAGMDAASQREALRHEAHAALARLELLQLASLPKPQAPTRWAFDLPVASEQGPAMAQFEISREAPQGGAADTEPVWRARFTLDLDGAGPVHAEVALHGARTRVTLWAEQEPMRTRLDDGRGDLTAALKGPDDADAAVRVLPGAPPTPAAAAGQLIDRTS